MLFLHTRRLFKKVMETFLVALSCPALQGRVKEKLLLSPGPEGPGKKARITFETAS
jgi:hypothetical protein